MRDIHFYLGLLVHLALSYHRVPPLVYLSEKEVVLYNENKSKWILSDDAGNVLRVLIARGASQLPSNSLRTRSWSSNSQIYCEGPLQAHSRSPFRLKI